MHVHFIAIGGAAMHNLAIALHLKGYKVSGSDDEIVDPSLSRLKKYGLLPEAFGWFPEKLEQVPDAIVLGMHARADNPELLAAREKGLRVYSYPEYIYEQTKQKTRVVIGGSHGKTSITAMILHVLKHLQIPCDYMVGAQLDGFECMVNLSEENNIAILEGDEYLSSPIDRRPKFHLYKPHIAVISGIAWDHINVFPTFENYTEQFSQFIDLIVPQGHLIYFQADETLQKIARQKTANKLHMHPYEAFPFCTHDAQTYLLYEGKKYPVKIFGRHNMQNLQAAAHVCKLLGIDTPAFLEAIGSFGGAARRLELVKAGANSAVFRDFAHAPSKLKATLNAVKEQYPERKLIACMELHTFSSLNKNFIQQYKDSLNDADTGILFYSPHTLALKKMPPVSPEELREAFGRPDLIIHTLAENLEKDLMDRAYSNSNLLLMSSGHFGGLALPALAAHVCGE